VSVAQLLPARGSTARVSGTPPSISRNYGFLGEAPYMSRKQIQNSLGIRGSDVPYFIRGGGGHFDGEAQILGNIAEAFRSRSPQDVRGVINLFTERPSCPSCRDMITIFQEQFPNITLNIHRGNLPLRN